MKLVTTSIMIVVTIVSARSCSGSSSSSPLNPSVLEQNGLSGLCANQEATALAGGDTTSAQTLDITGSQGATVPGLPSGTFNCSTTTTQPATAAPGS
jgi:hypothetical protein